MDDIAIDLLERRLRHNSYSALDVEDALEVIAHLNEVEAKLYQAQDGHNKFDEHNKFVVHRNHEPDIWAE